MRFLADENVPLMTVDALRALGHDVRDIRGTPDEGMPDDRLWDLAQREGRIVVTCNKGFTRHRSRPHCGILIVRLRRPNRLEMHTRILQAVDQIKAEDWPNLLVVMRDVAQSVWRGDRP
jgi:predicted nuclease of predicted toxin-antitoxin system